MGFTLVAVSGCCSLAVGLGLLTAVISLVQVGSRAWTSVAVVHGLSSYSLGALEHNQRLWCKSLLAPRHVGFSRIRDGTPVYHTGRRALSLSHREALNYILNKQIP